MDKESLELLLSQGLSIEKIATRFGKHPSTVSYWMTKHGLTAVNRQKHAARGGIERVRLEDLVNGGASIQTIALELQRSSATVRHWLSKYGLETRGTERRRGASAARAAGKVIIERDCRHHGLTTFWLEGRGSYRCLRCRAEAVSRRRRRIKEILVGEAGGACVICGYGRCLAVLHFHHVDPRQKSFALGLDGVARSIQRARAEAQKCVLLCSNCHGELENGVVSLPVESAEN